MDEEKSGNFNSLTLIEEKTPENPLVRKKKIDSEKISVFSKNTSTNPYLSIYYEINR